MGDKLFALDVEFQQRLLHGRGDKNIAVLFGEGERVDAHVVVHLGERPRRVAHDAAERHVRVVGYLVYRVLSCGRVPTRRFDRTGCRQRRYSRWDAAGNRASARSRRRAGHSVISIDDRCSSHGRGAGTLCGFSRSSLYSCCRRCEILCIVRGQARTIGIHALHHAEPLLGRALVAHEGDACWWQKAQFSSKEFFRASSPPKCSCDSHTSKGSWQTVVPGSSSAAPVPRGVP